MELNDPYISKITSLRRLINEWEQYKSIVVAYDFDNTIYDYNGMGFKFPVVEDLIRKCSKYGFHLVVFTSCDESRFGEIKDYLTKNNIPFHAINETPSFIPFSGRKVYYNLLLDDRAGLGDACWILDGLFSHIDSVKSMAGLQEIA